MKVKAKLLFLGLSQSDECDWDTSVYNYIVSDIHSTEWEEIDEEEYNEFSGIVARSRELHKMVMLIRMPKPSEGRQFIQKTIKEYIEAEKEKQIERERKIKESNERMEAKQKLAAEKQKEKELKLLSELQSKYKNA